eukprot:scpid41810/ scgid2162/ 
MGSRRVSPSVTWFQRVPAPSLLRQSSFTSMVEGFWRKRHSHMCTPEYHPNTGHLSQLQSGIHQRHATILNASPAYLSPLLASDEMLHSLPSVALLVSHYSTHGSTV